MEKRRGVLQKMKICRFCFNSNESELTSIYQKDEKTVPLPVQIMSCVSIEVFPSDGFPQLICSDCKLQTIKSYVFKSNCRKVDDAFKNYLQSGELVKPEIQPVARKVIVRHTQDDRSKDKVSVIEKTKEDDNDNLDDHSIDVKRAKLNDGTEVITLCISETDDPDNFQDISQDSEQEDSHVATEESKDEDQTEVEQVETDIFSCEFCDKTFPLQQLLDLHINSHQREKNFACSECNNKFFSKYDLANHLKVHSNEKPYECSVCEKRFSRESVLRRHETIHTDAARFLCWQCDKSFVTKADLHDHIKRHLKSRPFPCTLCTKNFVFKQGLERHMTSEHEGEKAHKCNYCSASFNTPIRLTRHVTTHAGLRPYPCKVCGRTFLLSHHLTRHMRSHYKQESAETVGQHKCDLCSMSFRRKDSLINHSVIHSMVNLRCVICNTSFEDSAMVRDHITTHLQGLPFPCEKCDYSFDTEKQLIEHEVKHAEMEYEDQIEQEVISETQKDDYVTAFEDDEGSVRMAFESNQEDADEEGEISHVSLTEMFSASDKSFNTFDIDKILKMTSYSIRDFDNPELVRPGKEKSDRFLDCHADVSESPSTPNSVKRKNEDNSGLCYFFKSKEDESSETADVDASVSATESEIKPVYRSEGTKMYERKGPIKRKLPEVRGQQTAALEEITEPSDSASMQVSTEKKASMTKPGDRVVKVQKFIISKDEMKEMAKMGILEVKNGKVFMNSPGQPMLNARFKPVQQKDIENLMCRKRQKPQVKQYDRKFSHATNVASEDVLVDPFDT
ncbi:zinc finger protein pita-like isoform X1 [Euwallacea similis]|uniref:zinc finger protein pita-like isoform X1 n=1 Tax=Euwallacea similis TaxID=1736056 RepID=UPI00344B8B10